MILAYFTSNFNLKQNLIIGTLSYLLLCFSLIFSIIILLNPTIQNIISNNIHQDTKCDATLIKKNNNKELSSLNLIETNKKSINTNINQLNSNIEREEFQVNKPEIDENNKNLNSKKFAKTDIDEYKNNEIIKKSNLIKIDTSPEWKKLQKIVNDKYNNQLKRES